MDYTVFRENLRILISNRGLTNKELSEEINIAAATISRYLCGTRKPELDYVIQLAEYFNVSIDWFLGIKECYDTSLTSELKQVLDKYSLATEDDRRVVQAVLQKYGDD